MNQDRRSNNQSENARAHAAAQAEGLTSSQQEQFHRQLGRMPDKDGLSYWHLREIARDVKRR